MLSCVVVAVRVTCLRGWFPHKTTLILTPTLTLTLQLTLTPTTNPDPNPDPATNVFPGEQNRDHRRADRIVQFLSN